MPQPTELPYRFESDRLVLRCYEPEDVHALLEAVEESMDALRPWIPWAQEEPSLLKFTSFVRRSRGDYDLMTNFNLAMIERQTGRLLGGAGLHRVDWEAGRFEIGYWLRRSAWGHGYASEAVGHLTRFVFERLSANRVELHIEVANMRSRALAERLGFTLEGVLRAHSRLGGTLRDLAVYAMIRPEYEARA